MTIEDSSSSESAGTARVVVLSSYEELTGAVLRSLGAETSGKLTLEDGSSVDLETLTGSPALHAHWGDALAKADACLMPLRFLDLVSLEKARGLLAALPRDKAPSLTVLALREKDEQDFKISCGSCGQKLWVRDADEGKRGRCPNCHAAFTLPSQEKHIRAELALPEETPLRVVNVAEGSPAGRRALAETLRRASAAARPPSAAS